MFRYGIFLIFLPIFGSLVAGFDLKCSPVTGKWSYLGLNIYYCQAIALDIKSPGETITSVNGATTPTKFVGLEIKGANVRYLPKGIAKFFPLLKGLSVKPVNLESIEASDLENLISLETLHIQGNPITELSSDLFKFTPKIDNAHFKGNKIQSIGENLLKNAPTLKLVSFEGNGCINNKATSDLETLKTILQRKCPENFKEKAEKMSAEMAIKEEMLLKEKAEKKAMEEEVKRLKAENANLVAEKNESEKRELSLKDKVKKMENEIVEIAKNHETCKSNMAICKQTLKEEQEKWSKSEADLKQKLTNLETEKSELAKKHETSETNFKVCKITGEDERKKFEIKIAEMNEKNRFFEAELKKCMDACSGTIPNECVIKEAKLRKQISDLITSLGQCKKDGEEKRAKWLEVENSLNEKIKKLIAKVSELENTHRICNSSLNLCNKTAEEQQKEFLKKEGKLNETIKNSETKIIKLEAEIKNCKEIQPEKCAEIQPEKCAEILFQCEKNCADKESILKIQLTAQTSSLVLFNSLLESSIRLLHRETTEHRRIKQKTGKLLQEKPEKGADVILTVVSANEITAIVEMTSDSYESSITKIVDVYGKKISPTLTEILIDQQNVILLPLNFGQVFSSLQVLTIIHSGLFWWDTRSFSGMHHLASVNFTGNKIVEISDEAFANLKNLVELDLSHNLIEIIGEKAFYENKELETLRLNNNQLVAINELIFMYQIKLRFLYLAFNKLTIINSELLSSTAIEFVDFRNNNCIDISPKIRAGNFKEIESIFSQKCVEPSELNCNHTLPANRYDEKYCRAVGLKIVHPGTVVSIKTTVNVKKIGTLEILDQKTFSLPSKLSETLPKLIQLLVQNSQLRILYKTDFKGLTMLKILIIQQNNISTIEDGVFDEVPQLGRLNLAYNNINSLSAKIFAGLINLRELVLTGNHLTKFVVDLVPLRHTIKEVELQKNRLTFVDGRSIGAMLETELIDLSDNDCINMKYQKSMGKEYFKEMLGHIQLHC